MAALITLEQAVAQLRLDLVTDGNSPPEITDSRLPFLEDKMVEATAVILDYLKKPDSDWTEETVPFVVRAAVLMALAALWEHAGDEDKDVASQDICITETVKSLLMRQRDPALA